MTFTEIEAELEKGDFTREQIRALAMALEKSQRKTATEVETDLRKYLDLRFDAIDEKFAALDKRFVTKEEFQKEVGLVRAEMGNHRSELMKWMFVCWSSQTLIIAGMLLGVVKLFRP